MFNLERMRHDLIAPGRVVDINFQDKKVGHRRGHGSGDERVERTVTGMRGNQDIVGMRQITDFFAHRDPVPGEVGHDDVLGMQL